MYAVDLKHRLDRLRKSLVHSVGFLGLSIPAERIRAAQGFLEGKNANECLVQRGDDEVEKRSALDRCQTTLPRTESGSCSRRVLRGTYPGYRKAAPQRQGCPSYLSIVIAGGRGNGLVQASPTAIELGRYVKIVPKAVFTLRLYLDSSRPKILSLYRPEIALSLKRIITVYPVRPRGPEDITGLVHFQAGAGRDRELRTAFQNKTQARL